MESDLCLQFLLNPRIHPLSGRPIVPGTLEYNQLIDACIPIDIQESIRSRPLLPRPPSAVTSIPQHRYTPSIPPAPMPRPIPSAVPMTAQQLVGEYSSQSEPTESDFSFVATPENSDFIQAAIATGRNVHPSLDFYLQLGIHLVDELDPEVHPLLSRHNYPFFMRDASPFEIFKVYKGLPAEKARRILTAILETLHKSPTLDGIIEENGFTKMYMGLIRSEFINQELTVENFKDSITSDQAILMEAYRKKVLTTSSTYRSFRVKRILGLGKLQDQIEHNRGVDDMQWNQSLNIDGISVNAPKHYQIGFKNDDLLQVIQFVNDRLPPRRQLPTLSNLIVDQIRREGEVATNKGYDRSQRVLPIWVAMPKEYYMLIFNMLIDQGLITDATLREIQQNNRR